MFIRGVNSLDGDLVDRSASWGKIDPTRNVEQCVGSFSEGSQGKQIFLDRVNMTSELILPLQGSILLGTPPGTRTSV